mgnify:CR=1 FL=1
MPRIWTSKEFHETWTVNAVLDFVYIYYKECIVNISNKNFILVGFYSLTLNGRRTDASSTVLVA